MDENQSPVEPGMEENPMNPEMPVEAAPEEAAPAEEPAAEEGEAMA